MDYYGDDRKEMIKYIPENAKNVLEAGCGKGVFASLIKEKCNAKVYGVEKVPDVAAVAGKFLDKVYTGDYIEIVNKLSGNLFDCVVFNDVIEHMENPWDALIKTKNIMNDNGVIVASIPNFRYLPNMVEILYKKDFIYKDCGILDKTHLRFFTKSSIIKLFNDTGYEIVTIEGIRRYTKRIRFFIFNLLSFGFFNDTQYLQFAVVAKKNSIKNSNNS